MIYLENHFENPYGTIFLSIKIQLFNGWCSPSVPLFAGAVDRVSQLRFPVGQLTGEVVAHHEEPPTNSWRLSRHPKMIQAIRGVSNSQKHSHKYPEIRYNYRALYSYSFAPSTHRNFLCSQTCGSPHQINSQVRCRAKIKGIKTKLGVLKPTLSIQPWRLDAIFRCCNVSRLVKKHTFLRFRLRQISL